MNHSAAPAIGAASGCAVARTTRSTPSPPIPARRSQSRCTRSSGRSSSPSGSGSSTKSFSVPCPLTNRVTPPGYGPPGPSRRSAGRAVSRSAGQPSGRSALGPSAGRGGEGLLHQVRGSGVQPHHPGVAAEPRLLPPGEPPGGPHRLVPGLLVGPLAGQVAQDLGVAKGPRRRGSLAQTLLGETTHLV